MNKVQLLNKLSLKNKKAQAMGLRGFVVTLVVAGLLFIIGLLVFSKVDNAIPANDFTAEQNASLENIRNTTLDSFDLGAIALIVLAAVVIIGTLFLLGRGA